MIDLELYSAFIFACIVLGLIPGPNVTLIIANSLAHGTNYGLMSVLGSSTAKFLKLIVLVLGATSLLVMMASIFEYIRWVGVAYLLYLGIQYLRTAEETIEIETDHVPKRLNKIYWQGFLISATNPKTLLFLGAFLPQFVDPSGDITIQLVVLSITLLVVISLIDACWAMLAGKARPFISRFSHWRNRLSGGFFIISSAGLALAKKQ